MHYYIQHGSRINFILVAIFSHRLLSYAYYYFYPSKSGKPYMCTYVGLVYYMKGRRILLWSLTCSFGTSCVSIKSILLQVHSIFPYVRCPTPATYQTGAVRPSPRATTTAAFYNLVCRCWRAHPTRISDCIGSCIPSIGTPSVCFVPTQSRVYTAICMQRMTPFAFAPGRNKSILRFRRMMCARWFSCPSFNRRRGGPAFLLFSHTGGCVLSPPSLSYSSSFRVWSRDGGGGRDGMPTLRSPAPPFALGALIVIADGATYGNLILYDMLSYCCCCMIRSSNQTDDQSCLFGVVCCCWCFCHVTLFFQV